MSPFLFRVLFGDIEFKVIIPKATLRSNVRMCPIDVVLYIASTELCSVRCVASAVLLPMFESWLYATDWATWNGVNCLIF